MDRRLGYDTAICGLSGEPCRSQQFTENSPEGSITSSRTSKRGQTSHRVNKRVSVSVFQQLNSPTQTQPTVKQSETDKQGVEEHLMYKTYKAQAMSSLKIVLFVGSCRDNRVGERVLTFIMGKLRETKHNVSVFDPREMKFELLKQPLHFYRDQSEAPEWLREAGGVVKDADAYLIVTPEYNATIPPALSNMMDHFAPKSYAYKPTGICTYSPGIFGGIRCNVALRAFINELGSVAVPSGFTISNVTKQLDENGAPLEDRMNTNAAKLLNNLEWYAEALKKQRETTPPPS